jgi:phosphatidylserine/phosphatidylglycerophosphate/cardiolipin synthase-like enzyme
MAKRSSNWWPLVLLLILAGAAAYYWRQQRLAGYQIEKAAPGEVVSENHLAPAEDLEQVDLDRLERAQHSLDIAMYAFTDRALGNELIKLARRGVKVRLYRDGEQYENEQKDAAHYGDESVNDSLRGQSGIQVRVKPPSRRDLMHLKAYEIDGRLLRDGSANWSEAGEKQQDNNARFTNDPQEIKNFERDFEAMWSRPGNTQVEQ